VIDTEMMINLVLLSAAIGVIAYFQISLYKQYRASEGNYALGSAGPPIRTLVIIFIGIWIMILAIIASSISHLAKGG